MTARPRLTPAKSVVRSVFLAALLLLACAPRALWAQPGVAPRPASSRAAELKEQANRAMDSLHYDDALVAYKAAYDLSKDPALLYNQARAYQALGDYATGLDLLERFESEAPPSLQARVPDLKGLGDDLRGKVSTLTLTSNAAGAEVVLRDKVLGTTPLEGPIRTTAGRAHLVVRGDRWKPFEKDIDLPGGQALTLAVDLEPRDTSAVLLVRSPVAGAHVTIDGALRGDAPLEIVTAPGLHSIVLARSGYETTETSAVLDPGATKAVDVPRWTATRPSGPFWSGGGWGAGRGWGRDVLRRDDREEPRPRHHQPRRDRGPGDPGHPLLASPVSRGLRPAREAAAGRTRPRLGTGV